MELFFIFPLAWLPALLILSVIPHSLWMVLAVIALPFGLMGLIMDEARSRRQHRQRLQQWEALRLNNEAALRGEPGFVYRSELPLPPPPAPLPAPPKPWARTLRRSLFELCWWSVMVGSAVAAILYGH